MSEMIDRVAVAILKAVEVAETWEELTPYWHQVYRAEARAAIEAMRDELDEHGWEIAFRIFDEALKAPPLQEGKTHD